MRLAAYYLLLATHYALRTTLLTAHYCSLLTTYDLLLTLLNTQHSLLATRQVDPVVASDGHSYERSAIQLVLQQPNPVSASDK